MTGVPRWGDEVGGAGRVEAGDGADEEGGAEGSEQGSWEKGQEPALVGRPGGGSDSAGGNAEKAAGGREQEGLGQELASDVASGGAEGSPEPDLVAPFENGITMTLAIPSPPDKEGDGAETDEEGGEGGVGGGAGGQRASEGRAGVTAMSTPSWAAAL